MNELSRKYSKLNGILRGWQLNEINEFANKIGAFVASQAGATPGFPEGF